jgi:hypothetical protein
LQYYLNDAFGLKTLDSRKAQIWYKFGKISYKLGQIWYKLSQIWYKFGQTWYKLSQIWDKLGHIWCKLGQILQYYLNDAFGLKTLDSRKAIDIYVIPGVQHVHWYRNIN